MKNQSPASHANPLTKLGFKANGVIKQVIKLRSDKAPGIEAHASDSRANEMSN